MVTEVQYINIRRVLEDLLEHPMLSDLTLEQVVRATMRFIGKFGFSKFYQSKETEVPIKEYKGLLPCDLVSISQVKDMKTHLCLRSMTDSFSPSSDYKDRYSEQTFKTQNRVIFTSFPEGTVLVAYKAVPVDEDGFPMVIDNEVYLEALEAYIKKQVFTVKFDQGKIAATVLQNAQQEYAVAAKLLQSEFTTPSYSEAQTLMNIWNTMIPQMRQFERGFRNIGNREYIRRH